MVAGVWIEELLAPAAQPLPPNREAIIGLTAELIINAVVVLPCAVLSGAVDSPHWPDLLAYQLELAERYGGWRPPGSELSFAEPDVAPVIVEYHGASLDDLLDALATAPFGERNIAVVFAGPGEMGGRDHFPGPDEFNLSLLAFAEPQLQHCEWTEHTAGRSFREELDERRDDLPEDEVLDGDGRDQESSRLVSTGLHTWGENVGTPANPTIDAVLARYWGPALWHGSWE